MYLLDASVLVAALNFEPHTSLAHDWLAAHSGDDVRASEWTITEFSAALSFKVRTKQISTGDAQLARRGFDGLLADSLNRLDVTTQHFQIGARFAAESETGLRAGDALHLGTAWGSGATMVTLDIRMANAARVLGVPCELLLVRGT